MIKVILIRHGARVQVENDRDGRYLPLSPDGEAEVARLCTKLTEESPRVYLSSHFLHAIHTAELLRNEIHTLPTPRVALLDSLTPKKEYTFESIVAEALANGTDFEELDSIAIILHQPRINQLIEIVGSVHKVQPLPLDKYGTAICLEAGSVSGFAAGNVQERWRWA